jgi:hypothetical protein
MFQFSPKELLLGLVINMIPTSISRASDGPSVTDIEVHMAYVEQQHLDGADQAVSHANHHKASFNQRVLKSCTGEVIFETGQLVQIYANAFDMLLASSRKLQPRWSALRHITSKVGNSYTVSMLEGFPINGLVHARRLHLFIPRDGTALALLQEMLTENIIEEDLPSTWEQGLDTDAEEVGMESESKHGAEDDMDQ